MVGKTSGTGKRKHRKKALHKEFWMEVRKSRARFISIFCIVALGVAFFSGIQAASPDMRMSGDAYYNISKLMDLKIIGTMGLTEDDVKAVQELSGVGSVEGAYSTDVICGENDSLKVLHVESLNKEVNQLTLTEGSLPEKSGECFLDSTFAESQGYEVGSKLVIRQDGDSKLLKTEEYTVTGIGKSPLYISFNRGNTTVGSGEVNGFAYVLPEEFDSEFFTQIYVRTNEVEKVTSYTDAYENLIDKVQKKVEGIEEGRCQIRYDKVMSEAQDKISDAEKELEDGKKEADEKLADAKKKLDDGEKELKDGEKKYNDGKKQLEDARKELEDGKKQLANAKTQIRDGRSQIASAKEQAADGRTQLEAAQKQLDDGWSQYNAGKQQYDEGKAKFDAAKKEFEAGKQKIADAKADLDKKQQELTAGIAQVKAGQTTVDTQIAQLNAQIPQLEAGISQLEQAAAGLAGAQQAVEAAQSAVSQAQDEVNAAQAAYDEAKQKADAGDEEAKAQLDALAQNLSEAQAALGDANTAVGTAQATLNACQQADAQKTELENNLAAANSGLTTLQAKKTELAGTLATLNENQTQIDSGRTTLNAQEAKLISAQKELDTNEKTLAASKKQLDASLKKLQSGQSELDANRTKLDSADAEIAASGIELEYEVGTMIEIPRAALTADEIAKEADFFCFGTNDLTQMTFGFSRDDAGKFLDAYYDAKIYENDPFAKLDQKGVGKLMEMAIALGKEANPNLHIGICGEHGGDPSSVEFCNELGLNYVSCSPFRVPIAKLSAAQAAINQK